jgi:hypothetical protein
MDQDTNPPRPALLNDRSQVFLSFRAALIAITATAAFCIVLVWVLGVWGLWQPQDRATHHRVLRCALAVRHGSPLPPNADFSRALPDISADPRAKLKVMHGPQPLPGKPGVFVEPEQLSSSETAFQIMARDRWTVVAWYSSSSAEYLPIVLIPHAPFGQEVSDRAMLHGSDFGISGDFTLPNPD